MSFLINLSYIASALLFIFGLKFLSSPSTARQGNMLSSMGMMLAVVMTLFDQGILTYQWIVVGLVAGSILGAVGARIVAMTSMPEMVALLNGFGGISSLLVGAGVFYTMAVHPVYLGGTIVLSVLIGGLTFTGSLVAWAKLNGRLSARPFLYKGQQWVNGLLLGVIVYVSFAFVLPLPEMFGVQAEKGLLLWILVGLSFLLGLMTVISIGGGDMPVVISLLNSYSGLAACAAGFVIQNNLLIVAGALVGASGIILTNIMCKSMNRSLANVLFSGFGATDVAGSEREGEVHPASVEDTYYLLEAASSILFVPGYGMAVAQAQHAVRELADLLEEKGCEVRFAIHPVAGRMPGHMNVLLAEADVPYEQLAELDDVNPTMAMVDVCVVIGANDVVNPDARDNEKSSIYGMPIVDVDRAKTVIVLKRSMGTGFAGIANPLFFKTNTRMLFGDAKSSIQSLVGEFKDG